MVMSPLPTENLLTTFWNNEMSSKIISAKKVSVAEKRLTDILRKAYPDANLVSELKNDMMVYGIDSLERPFAYRCLYCEKIFLKPPIPKVRSSETLGPLGTDYFCTVCNNQLYSDVSGYND